MTPIDITGKLELASKKPDWTRAMFQQTLQELSSALSGSSVDWDRQAGEEWGRVILERKVVALLWLRRAFAFLEVSQANVLSSILNRYSIQFEVVDDWEEAYFKIDQTLLLQLSVRSPLLDDLDPAAFSVNELWWATV